MEGISENFPFSGHLPLKFSKLKDAKQVLYNDQPTSQRTHCRAILFTARCSPRARKTPGKLLPVFCPTYVLELRGVSSTIFAFWPIFAHAQSVRRLQPRDCIAECFRLLSRRSRQRERFSASMLSICSSVCLSSKCKNAIFSKT